MFDEFGRQIKVDFTDPVDVRLSIADALKGRRLPPGPGPAVGAWPGRAAHAPSAELAVHMGAAADLTGFLSFLVRDGFADRSEGVRSKMLDVRAAGTLAWRRRA